MATIRPLAQNGGFTGLANIRYRSVQMMVNNNFVNTTGSKGGVSDTVNRACEAMQVVRAVGQGSIELDSGGACAKAQLGYMAPGDVLIQPQLWSLRRLWPLQDVTGSDGFTSDTDKRWQSGLYDLMGNANGWVKKDGPVYTQQRSPLALKIDLVGEFDLQHAIINNLRLTSPYTTGNVFRSSFNWRADAKGGGYTFTPVGTNFSSTMGHALTEPLSDDIEIDLDTGETIAHYATLEDIQFSNRSVRGGPVDVRCVWRFNQEDDAAPSAASSFAVTAGSGQNGLAWDSLSSTHTYFLVQRRTGTNDFEGIKLLAPTATSYTDTDVVVGTEYDYKLVSGNAAGTALTAEDSGTPT